MIIIRIGVFDSGIGGLTVLMELYKKLPYSDYIYYGDTSRMPYGNKDSDVLLKYSREIIDFLISLDCDIIVIACGTLSARVYKDLVEIYNIPIIDVISHTINYLNKTNINDLLVMCTDNTFNSKIFDDINITNKTIIPCGRLASSIEFGNIDINSLLDYYLKNVDKSLINNVLLGCTHYPLIVDELNEYFNKDINYINMGTHVSNYIIENFTNDISNNGKIQFYFSELNNSIIHYVLSYFNSTLIYKKSFE